MAVNKQSIVNQAAVSTPATKSGTVNAKLISIEQARKQPVSGLKRVSAKSTSPTPIKSFSSGIGHRTTIH